MQQPRSLVEEVLELVSSKYLPDIRDLLTEMQHTKGRGPVAIRRRLELQRQADMLAQQACAALRSAEALSRRS